MTKNNAWIATDGLYKTTRAGYIETMSRTHPIISITGSSGAGTSSAHQAIKHFFSQHQVRAAIIEGDGFHRYNREEMDRRVQEAAQRGVNLTHFGPGGNCFDKLEELFREYAAHGTGRHRYYIHNGEESARHGFPPGSLTPWRPLESHTDLLFYEGLHGGLVTDVVDIAQYVDLLIGVVPIINLEWIQKTHRDQQIRGYKRSNAIELILDRMHDYVHYITPQFSRTDINFQRVPTVDTSNPFDFDTIPTETESFLVIHIRDRRKIAADFSTLQQALENAFVSAPDTLVVPAEKMSMAMQMILGPVLMRLVEDARKARAATAGQS